MSLSPGIALTRDCSLWSQWLRFVDVWCSGSTSLFPYKNCCLIHYWFLWFMVCETWSQHVLGMVRWQNGTVQWGYSLYLCFRLLFGHWSHSKQSSWGSHRVQFFWSSGYAYALIVPMCLCISEKTVCTTEFIAFWPMKCVSEFVGSLQCLTSSSSGFVKSYHCSICTSVLLLTSLSFRVWFPLFPVLWYVTREGTCITW